MSQSWFGFVMELVCVVNYTILFLFILQNVFYFLWLVLAVFELRRSSRYQRRSDPWGLLTRDTTLSISLLVPSHDEEANIAENIHSLLSLQYPEFEVIVINDGSTDRTLQVILEKFELKPIEKAHHLEVPHQPIRGFYASPRYPRLLVVDKGNGGKADALNAGVNLARYPIVCSIDADSILDPKALMKVIRPFIEEPERMVAAGGTIRIANGSVIAGGQIVKMRLPRQTLALFQSIEYIRSFLVARLGWSRMRSMLVISGAFGLFKRMTVIQAGGYSSDTVGEDAELVVKLHRYLCDHDIPYQMRYVPDPICWTEVPEKLSLLQHQRTRWQRGLMEILMKHRRMIFNPRYGPVGLIGLPVSFLFDAILPCLELLGMIIIPLYWWLGMLSFEFLLAFFMLEFVFGIFISVGSLVIAEVVLRQELGAPDLLRLSMAAIVEHFGYRQLNNYWRFLGIWHFLRGKQGWGKMVHSGFSTGKNG